MSLTLIEAKRPLKPWESPGMSKPSQFAVCKLRFAFAIPVRYFFRFSISRRISRTACSARLCML